MIGVEIPMTIRQKLYTAEDLGLISRGGNEKVYELVRGELVEVTPSAAIHTILASWINYILTGFVVAHDLGVVTGEIGGYILFKDPDTVRAPDVGFISKARFTSMPESFFPFPPDLAVEIVSTGDTASEVDDKVEDYLTSGTRLVWVIYPKTRKILVYKPGDAVQVVRLDGADLLPGFSVPAQQIFKPILD